MKKVCALILVGAVSVMTLAGCSSFRAKDELATVDGAKLFMGEANFYARYIQAQYQSYMGEDMWATEVEEGKTYEDQVKENLLKEMETMLLLEKHMGDYKVALSEKEIKVIEETAKEFSEANTQEVKEKISGDDETVKRVLTLLAVQQKMSEAIMEGADTEVSDEEAAQKAVEYVTFAYTKTDGEGQSIELSEDEKKELRKSADAVLEGLKNGGDFAQMAKDYGVEVQPMTFDKETTYPNEAFIKAADALAEGGITEVVETEEGCYIGRLTSLLDREATDAKKESIVSERKNTLYTETCDKWLKEADIKVKMNQWKKVNFTQLNVQLKLPEE